MSDYDEGFRDRKEKLTSADREYANEQLREARRQSDSATASYWEGWIAADNES